jgi:hypothetical protein
VPDRVAGYSLKLADKRARRQQTSCLPCSIDGNIDEDFGPGANGSKRKQLSN